MTTLAGGTTAALGANRWHNLRLDLSGSIKASIDGTSIALVAGLLAVRAGASARFRDSPTSSAGTGAC